LAGVVIFAVVVIASSLYLQSEETNTIMKTDGSSYVTSRDEIIIK